MLGGSLLFLTTTTSCAFFREPATVCRSTLAILVKKHYRVTPQHVSRSITMTRWLATASPRGGGACGQGVDDEKENNVPPLRYLGDKQLMQPQSPVTRHEMEQTDNFATQLEMLRRAMDKYGGIGIAGPQVGWWTRYVPSYSFNRFLE